MAVNAHDVDTATLDLLYIVRPGDDNEELRHSLRSVAANLPHRSVWVAGHCPVWVRNVERLELEPLEDKFENQRQSLAAALARPGLSDPFVLMNDDMFVTQPLERLPVWHLGPLATLIADLRSRAPGSRFARNSWRRGLAHTEALMHGWGYENPDAYEAHVPLPFDKMRLAQVLEDAPRDSQNALLWGCAYDACGAVPGVEMPNAKVSDTIREPSREHPFVSTSDKSFAIGAVGIVLRKWLPEPCQYEEA